MTVENQITRLLSYKRMLNRFKSLGLVKIFSDNIADPLGISASLVRKDFSMFGISGSQKGGYTIDSVLGRINEVLGCNRIQKVIVVGVGRIGEALISYNGFHKDGIHIVAGFDTDLKKIKKNTEIPVEPVEQLQDYVKAQKITVAIMAVPDMAAQQTIELLRSAGIKGIMNFTGVKFKSSEELIVNNFNIENELVNLIYFVNNNRRNGKTPEKKK